MFSCKTVSVVFVVILILFNLPIIAQTSPILEGSNITPFELSGSASIGGQLYNANGIENRRAPATGEGNMNVNFSVFGIKSGFNLLYSSDDSRFRQSMNKINFSGRWKFIQLSLGTVSPSFSKYGLNGATITGGDLVINPGIFYFEITGGQSQRAVQPDTGFGFVGGAYKRMMYAAKIGVGNDQSSHVFLSTVYAKDDSTSLPYSVNVKPQENISVTPDFAIQLFGNHFNLKGEATVSAFTEDLRSSALDLSKAGVPSFVTSIFKPRVSSRLNYAANLQSGLNFENINLLFGYTRIQPGFYSLGVSQLRDDQQQFRAKAQLGILNHRLTIGGNFSLANDNLLGDRISTLRTSNYGINVNARITDRLILNTAYTLLLNDDSPTGSYQDSANVFFKRSQNAQSILIQPTLSIQSGMVVHSISLSASFLSLKNQIGGPQQQINQNYNSNTFTSTLSYSISLPSGLTITAIGNFLKSNSGSTQISNTGGTAGVTYSFFKRKLNTSLNFGFNANSTTSTLDTTSSVTKLRQITISFNSSYRLTGSDTIIFSARSLNNATLQGVGYSFTEYQARLLLQHNF